MATGSETNDAPRAGDLFARPRVWEAAGLLVLALLAAYFLRVSWRKWPDPIVDVGPQWYDIWRVSLGAAPYHDFLWNYGPLSLLLNGLLFKCFGPGMMVLVTANLAVYGGIVALAYLAFRRRGAGWRRSRRWRFSFRFFRFRFSTASAITITPRPIRMRPRTACCCFWRPHS